MSEVERPSNDHSAKSANLVESKPSTDSVSSNQGGIEENFQPIAQLVNPLDQDGWETVDFPGARPIQEIPLDSSVAQVVAIQKTDGVDVSIDELTPVMGQLQQENQELRDHIAQLEQDLSQEQIERQLVQSNLLEYERQSENVAALKAEMTALQEQISRHSQELELAHQANQRQEILVDTLTKQLESSQERNAQLERECALVQQRYNEQVQQLLQSENQCRDLRTRLHRQQQQTLQFKAALEKSLEMATPTSPLSIAGVEAINVNGEQEVNEQRVNRLADLVSLQNQPVQPWSAVYGGDDNGSRSVAVNPLSKLLNGNSAASLQLPDLDQIMEPSQEALEAVAVNPIFDLEPFIKAGEVSSAIVVSAVDTEEPVENNEAVEDLSAENIDDDPLWQDLARLINAVETSIDGVKEQATLKTETIQASSDQVDSDPEPLPVAVEQSVPETQTDETIAVEESATLPVGTTAWPAPVVYPTRSGKKLSSLAAVDLPVFPRPQNAEATSKA